MFKNPSIPIGQAKVHRNGKSPILIWAGILVLGVSAIVPQAVAQEAETQAAAEGTGLSGINSQFPPPELDIQFLADDLMEQGFPESWQEWARELHSELVPYFNLMDLDIPAQRNLIDKLRLRVATMKRAIEDPRYRPLHDVLYSLAEPLDSHLKLSSAILDTLEEGIVPLSEKSRKRAFEDLRNSTRNLQAFLSEQDKMEQHSGEQWARYFRLSPLSKDLAESNGTSEEFRQRINLIHERLQDREDYSADQLRLLRNNAFWPFRRAVARVHSILQWEQTPPTKKTLRLELRNLSRAFTDLDDHNLIEHGQTLQLAWDQLELLNPNSTEHFAFLHDRFYSDNLHTLIAEDVFDEVVHERRTDREPISEVSQGAVVTGTSVTKTEASLDLIPSPEEALLAVNVRGDIESDAQAKKCSIKVYTQGESRFWAKKPAYFDGFRFLPEGATISVDAANFPYAAETPFSCLPGFGPCFEEMVLDQANAQRPSSEAEMRQRIANRVVPELDREINKAFAEANREFEDNRYARLSRNNLYPASMKTATTDSHFLSRTLIRNQVELGGSSAPTIWNQPTGANLHIHESLLNNVAARMNVAGRTMTEAEFRAEASRFFTDLTGYEVDLSQTAVPTPDETPAQFVFDKVSPLRVQIRDGQLQLTLRLGVVRENEEDLPAHDVTIPISYKLEGDEILILIDKDTLKVGKARGETIAAQNTEMRRVIQSLISDGRRSRFFKFNMQDGKTLTMRMERIKAINGWLSLWAVPVENGPTEPMEMP